MDYSNPGYVLVSTLVLFLLVIVILCFLIRPKPPKSPVRLASSQKLDVHQMFKPLPQVPISEIDDYKFQKFEHNLESPNEDSGVHKVHQDNDKGVKR